MEVAEVNVKANALSDRVRCVEAAGFDHAEIARRGPFDLVFANILKGPLMDMAPDMGAHVAAGGYAILSGILTSQADEVVSTYLGQGFALSYRDEIGEWTTLVLVRGQ